MRPRGRILSFSRDRIGRLRPLCAALFVLALTTAGCSGENASPSGTPASPSTTITGTLAPASASQTTTSPSVPVGILCGSERWPVKTLSDQDAGSVNFTPVPSSVAALRGLPAPASKPQSSRVPPTELTLFTVTAELVELKLEDDRDVHLVIAEPGDPSATMIVEFPDADNCTGAIASAHAPEIRAARAALIAAFGQPNSSGFTYLSGTAIITGVGFFDFVHGQTGVAPNGIELHPVLAFTR